MPENAARRWSWKKILGIVFTAAMAVLAVLGAMGVITLQPTVSITASDLVNHKQPFSAKFVITNESWFSIYDIITFCDVNSFDGGNFVMGGFSVSPLGVQVPELRKHESHTAYCELARIDEGKPLPAADITMRIGYRSLGISWQTCTRFVGARGDSWSWQTKACSATQKLPYE